MITLRFVLLALATVTLTASVRLGSASMRPDTKRSEPSLRDLAKRRHLILGSAMPALSLRNNIDNGRYAAAAIAAFNLMELENDLKPPAVWAGPHEYHLDNVDFILGEPGKKGWAQTNGFKFRGHVLVYARDDGYTLPQWIRRDGEKLSKEEASELLHDYIKAVAGRYRGKISMWDVANEAIDDSPNQNPFNLRNSFWFRKLGPEFLVLAFKWAHEADPKAQLYYNEYGIEGGGPKAQHMLDLLKWLKEQHAPITGAGLQYHIDCRTSVTPGDGHYQLIDAIQKLGLSYMITELDVAVPLQQLPASDPNRGRVPKNPSDLDAQAKVYRSVFEMALASHNCHGVQIWGVSDQYSWIPGFSRGRDGLATLYDWDFKPKPAYSSIAELLAK